jgi:predicted metalloprotease with PDZ domain
MPNGVNLSGSFDWFYEGLALYESLKLGVSLNRIRFYDYLDTLSRAINIDTLESNRGSLIEMSKNRWNGANAQLYARGMLVAFAFDVALLAKSGGKRSVTEVLREVFTRHRIERAQDGNTAILKILRGYPELVPIIDRTVTGNGYIVWEPLLSPVGLETEARGRSQHLGPVAKPSGRQRDLLDKLGYNSWRKLSGGKR